MRKPEDLDTSIKKLMKSIHGEEIDEKIDAKISEIRNELDTGARRGTDMTPLIAGLRETKDRLSRLESGVGKLAESMSKKSPGPEQESIYSALQAEMARLSSELKEDAATSKDLIEDLQNQISGIRGMFGEMREIYESMKSLDFRSMARDIESLKQKLAWLEQHSGSGEIESIKERLEEAEARLGSMKLGSPLVIE